MVESESFCHTVTRTGSGAAVKDLHQVFAESEWALGVGWWYGGGRAARCCSGAAAKQLQSLSCCSRQVWDYDVGMAPDLIGYKLMPLAQLLEVILMLALLGHLRASFNTLLMLLMMS